MRKYLDCSNTGCYICRQLKRNKMTKKEIKRRLLNLGFQSHYSGKTKTFYIDNCSEHYQCILFNDIESLGFKIVKN